MKKIMFAIFLAFLTFPTFGQSEWNKSKSSSNGDLKRVGLFLNGDLTNIYRNTNELPALGEGSFEGGILLGKKTAFVVKGGIYTQSDFFVNQSQNQNMGTGGSQYQSGWANNYDCGCGGQNQNQPTSNRFQYIRIGHFQVGLANQGESYGFRATAGIGSFDYQVPVVDSLGNETPQQIAEGTVFALGFDLKTRIGKDMFNARLQSFTNKDNLAMSGTIGKIEADYLLGLEDFDGKLFIGLGGAAKKHVVSGDEYSARVIVEFGHDEFPFWLRAYLGAAYNPLPSEGVGFEFGFQIAFDRFARSLYR